MWKHKYLVRTKWFRVYLRGSYSFLEIDLGKLGLGHKELIIHLFTKEGKWIDWHVF